MTLYEFIDSAMRRQREITGRQLSYLELGTQDGGSADAALKSGTVDMAVLIDTWGEDYGGTNRGSPDFVIQRLGAELMRNTIILTGDTKTIAPLIAHKFDVIFVDADHSEAGCLADMENALKLLCENGMLLVDDTDHPVHTYIRNIAMELAKSHSLEICFHDAHFGLAELRRKQ